MQKSLENQTKNENIIEEKTEKPQTIDYKTELAAISDKQYPEFWKPEGGTHKVVFTSEAKFVDLKDKTTGEPKLDDHGKPIIKLMVEIVSRGTPYTWSSTKGSTTQAASVQIIALGSKFGGLKGKEATVIVKMGRGADGGLKRDYTILEAQDVFEEKNVEIKKREDAKAFL